MLSALEKRTNTSMVISIGGFVGCKTFCSIVLYFTVGDLFCGAQSRHTRIVYPLAFTVTHGYIVYGVWSLGPIRTANLMSGL